ncbi:Transcription elongation factor A protein 2 [Trebouxia sp. C0010 RCD-2024]
MTQVEINEAFEHKLAHVLNLSNSDIAAQQNTLVTVAELKELASYPVTVDLLSQTRAGIHLAKLSKNHPNPEVREAATSTSSAWRTTISASQLGHYLQQRGNVSVPSSSCAGLLPMYARNS